MHEGVSASAAGHMDAVAENLCNGVLHGLLYRGEIGLTLPAVIGRAVIPKAQGNISHTPYLVRTIEPASTAAQKASAR